MKRYFEFDKYGTNYKREILGGITTFLSMAYILAVNPQILSLAGVKGISADMKMDQGAIFVATALAAFVGCMFMGIIARYPIALAPGMGLNAFFAFTVVLTMGIPWQVGLTGVLFSGVIFAILTVTGLRETIINAIPFEMKMAVSAGIGLFITFVGLQSSGIIAKNDSTLVTLGSLTHGPVLLAIFGIVITFVLYARKIPGAIFIGMVITAIAGLITGQIGMPSQVVGAIPSIEPTFGAAFEAFKDPAQLFTLQFLIVILTFLFIDFFDTAGTLMAVASQAGMMKDNKLPRAGRALFADSIATGIACGFVFYPITMLVTKRHKEVHPIMYGLMVLFILYFIFVHG